MVEYAALFHPTILLPIFRARAAMVIVLPKCLDGLRIWKMSVNMKTYQVFFLMLTLCIVLSGTADAQFIQVITGDTIGRPDVAMTWEANSHEEITLPLHFTAPVSPKSLIVGLNPVNGFRILALYSGVAVRIPLKIPKDFDGIGNYQELKKGYRIEVIEHNFDNSEDPQVVIAIGNGEGDLIVNIVQYHAPQFQRDAVRSENWTVVGDFIGQYKVVLDGPAVKLPFGSQGLRRTDLGPRKVRKN